VAFACPANAAPYLYAVPPDLACFSKLLKRFGVRAAFTSGDFVQVTRQYSILLLHHITVSMHDYSAVLSRHQHSMLSWHKVVPASPTIMAMVTLLLIAA
jgi:hypothetical protein